MKQDFLGKTMTSLQDPSSIYANSTNMIQLMIKNMQKHDKNGRF